MNQESERRNYFPLLLTAHIAMLGKQEMIDDTAVRKLAGIIDRTSDVQFEESNLADRLSEFDLRVDSQSPRGYAGVTRIARGANELIAAHARMELRDWLLDLTDQVDQLREDLIHFATQHVVTIMPAYQQGFPAQPTTMAHMVGALIGPYDRAHKRIQETYTLVNQSPLGAGALVSTSLPIDREDAAANAGFDGVIENTFDAVAAIDHFAAISSILRGITSPIARFMGEMAIVYRTDPSAMVTRDASPRTRGELPQHTVLPVFEDIDRLLVDIHALLDTVDRWLDRAPLEPMAEISQPLDRLKLAFAATGQLIARFQYFINSEIAFNRAYLANRANYNYTTVSELTDYLMVEHHVSPADAREMTARVMSQLLEKGRDIGGLEPKMIDTAAMFTTGRELGVEIESLGKYLAPRRFIERRAGLGGPAPSVMRAWLQTEELRLATDRNWTAKRREALANATDAMKALADDE